MNKNKIQEEKENLEIFKNFLNIDMKIKEELLNLAPSKLDDYNEESRIAYANKLYQALENLETEFLLSIKNIKIKKTDGYEEVETKLQSEIQDSISNYFSKAKEQFEIGRYDLGICQKLYKEQFSNIRTNYVEKVKEVCIGYGWENKRIKDVNNLINGTQTINELLHLLHSYIVNNECILQSLCLISQKENNVYEKINLYGEENEIAEKIFDEFPLDLDCGTTDIISLENKVLMMVRDRGHALSIDIDISDESVMVKYFLPKTYTWVDKSFIEELPGVNSKTITENGALGAFCISKDELAKKLFGFINKVPTDDMVMKKCRSNENQDINGNENYIE